MGDKMLAGYETVGTYEPIQLYAGENQVVTTQGVLKAGNKVGLLNARNETYKFPLVGVDAQGKLVPWTSEDADTVLLKGVLPHALDTSATGYNADTDTPVIVQGVLNFEAMAFNGTDAGGSANLLYAAIRVAPQAPGTNITFQKLY